MPPLLRLLRETAVAAVVIEDKRDFISSRAKPFRRIAFSRSVMVKGVMACLPAIRPQEPNGGGIAVSGDRIEMGEHVIELFQEGIAFEPSRLEVIPGQRADVQYQDIEIGRDRIGLIETDHPLRLGLIKAIQLSIDPVLWSPDLADRNDEKENEDNGGQSDSVFRRGAEKKKGDQRRDLPHIEEPQDEPGHISSRRDPLFLNKAQDIPNGGKPGIAPEEEEGQNDIQERAKEDEGTGGSNPLRRRKNKK